jgi:protein-S-isoprenylcysteine O-methyltransferase Ste14
MATTATVPAARPRLTAAGIGRLATVLVSGVLQAAVFFVAAGRIDVHRAWLYYGAVLGYLVVSIVLMLAFFPAVADVVNERGKIKSDVKSWDKVFGIGYTVLLMLVVPVVAGLDAGRFGWTDVSVVWAVPATVLTLLSYAFVHWAMVVNRYAETGVRIQSDRGHEVVTTGPYRFVRHPFYIGIIIVSLLYPLAIGSLWAFVPEVGICLLFVVRTAAEDRTLQAELPGYAEYTRKTRYRLVPGVW